MKLASSLSARLGAASLFLVAATAATGCDVLAGLLGAPEPYEMPEAGPAAPISGGTLLVTADGALAVAADSDLDRVYVVDLADRTVLHDVALEPGEEPGRVVEGPDGIAYVALRNGGAVAAVDLETGDVTRRAACPAPRGLAYDAARDQLHVACAGGELVTFPSDPAATASRTLRLTPDIRDVVIHGDQLLVSRFRAADILVVSAAGGVSYRMAPGSYASPSDRHFEPGVAWRMVPVPGGVAVVHQRAFADMLPTGPAGGVGTYYGGPCDMSVVHSAVSIYDADAAVRVTLSGMGAVGNLTLPVDMAVSAEGRVAVVAAGASVVFETSLDAVQTTDLIADCNAVREGDRTVQVGSPVAVAYGAAGELLVQGRDGVLTILPPGGVAETVRLSEFRTLDAGHILFHHAPSPSAPVACASCHPEGRDDGHVWHFQALGPRRTQNMLGGVLDTAPLHWEGDMDGLDALMGEVFVNRMGGAMPDEATLEALGDWMQTLPALPPSAPRDAAAAARGEALFLDPEVKCADCHAGPALTNNTTVDVGTGRPFQVPSLAGIAARAPFMHDGCASTLRERFDPECGGGDAHGKTSHLTEEEVDNLVAYLETL